MESCRALLNSLPRSRNLMGVLSGARLVTAVGMIVALGVVPGCTTSFPLSLIEDGDGGTDADSTVYQDGGVDSGEATGVDAGLDGSVSDAAPDAQTTDAQITPCGNGLVESPEECDDGSTLNGDGCDSNCLEEEGWDCVGAPSQCAPICGDGLIRGGEECDDSNLTSGDSCSASCIVDCANGSTDDCNAAGETLNPAAAFVDPTPPAGFVQCAGFENTNINDVGPDWDASCLGAERTLRIRYWDASNSASWVLLGDATLSPASLASYATQTFDATNHGGTQGVLETAGVVFLKDDPAVGTVSEWLCDPGPDPRAYFATDLYFANTDNDQFVVVCGYSEGDNAAAPCGDGIEIRRKPVAFEQCLNESVSEDDLAIAIYYEL